MSRPLRNQDVLSLIRAHIEHDDDRFLSVAESIGLNAGAAGQANVAASIERLVDKGRRIVGMARRALPHEVEGVVTVSVPTGGLSGLVLSDGLGGQLARIVAERRHADALAERGLSPRRRLLLCGPPGTGKTMTAAALAGELGLDLYAVKLSGLISRYMGATGAKLANVFALMATNPGVYLFDEVDALASARDGGHDVGEMRRVVNTLLQSLDDDASGNVIVATTNMPGLLDPAALRRFDAVLRFPLPTRDVAMAVLSRRLEAFDVAALDHAAVHEALAGLSQADVVSAAEDAGREAVIAHGGTLTRDIVLQALAARGDMGAAAFAA